MPPCYTFNKVCLSTDEYPFNPCGTAQSCPIQDWFWWLAAAVAAGLLIANSGGGK